MDTVHHNEFANMLSSNPSNQDGYTLFTERFNVDIDAVHVLQENLLERGLFLPCPLRTPTPACLWSLGIPWLGSRHSDLHNSCTR